MNVITLRSAKIEDLPILLEFEQGVIAAERPFVSTLKKNHINYYDISEMIEAEHIELIVAQIGDEIIGSGYARIEKPKSYHHYDFHAYIGFMYVKPAHRGKGISKKILDALIAWAKSREVYEIRLDVYNDNWPAVRAYEKAGFKKELVRMSLNVED